MFTEIKTDVHRDQDTDIKTDGYYVRDERQKMSNQAMWHEILHSGRYLCMIDTEWSPRRPVGFIKLGQSSQPSSGPLFVEGPKSHREMDDAGIPRRKGATTLENGEYYHLFHTAPHYLANPIISMQYCLIDLQTMTYVRPPSYVLMESITQTDIDECFATFRKADRIISAQVQDLMYFLLTLSDYYGAGPPDRIMYCREFYHKQRCYSFKGGLKASQGLTKSTVDHRTLGSGMAAGDASAIQESLADVDILPHLIRVQNAELESAKTKVESSVQSDSVDDVIDNLTDEEIRRVATLTLDAGKNSNGQR